MLYKGLKHGWILVSALGPESHFLQIPRDVVLCEHLILYTYELEFLTVSVQCHFKIHCIHMCDVWEYIYERVFVY